MIFLMLFITTNVNFNLVAHFPHGSWGYPLIAFDSDHNGTDELFFHSFGDTGTVVCEHLGNNQYIVSTLYGEAFTAVGYGDTDSLTDAFGKIWTPPSFNDPIGIYESRNYNSYPDSFVCCIADSTPWGPLGYFVDFDQDGQVNLITVYDDINVVTHFCLFENTGNNNYTKAFEYDFPNSGPGEIAIDDFDGDGLLEIVCGDVDSKVYVFENTEIGVDSFQLVWTYVLPFGAAYFTAKSNDMNQNGKPEFIFATGVTDRYSFTVFESDSNNSYRKVWQKIYYYPPGLLPSIGVTAGDVDGDGIDEMVTFGGLVLNVWKCVGPDSFVSIWERWYYGDLTDGVLLVHDLNQNGLGEIVVSGGSTGPNPPAKTYIYEKMPSVTWIYPSQYDTLWANDTVNLIWKLDETVSLESLRLYIAHPLMGCWLVYQGLPQDTTCTFVVPDTQSNMAFKFWVAVRGYLRYDSIVSPPFYIKRRTGIEEADGWPTIHDLCLEVWPNPFTTKLDIRYEIPDTRYEITNEHISDISYLTSVSLKIYDATGRLVKSFNYQTIQPSNHLTKVVWSGDDDSGHKLPAGVYFIKLDSPEGVSIEKVVKLE